MSTTRYLVVIGAAPEQAVAKAVRLTGGSPTVLRLSPEDTRPSRTMALNAAASPFLLRQRLGRLHGQPVDLAQIAALLVPDAAYFAAANLIGESIASLPHSLRLTYDPAGRVTTVG